MFRTTKLIVLFALLVGELGARAADKPAPDPPFDNATFVKDAALSGLYEVALANLVTPQTKNEDVKKFTELMVKEHTTMNGELKKAAVAAGVSVPTKIDDQHKQKYDAFETAYKSASFDPDYLQAMIGDLDKDIDSFTRASKEAKDTAIKDFATKALPTLKKQQEIAKKILEKLKK